VNSPHAQLLIAAAGVVEGRPRKVVKHVDRRQEPSDCVQEPRVAETDACLVCGRGRRSACYWNRAAVCGGPGGGFAILLVRPTLAELTVGLQAALTRIARVAELRTNVLQCAPE